MPSGSGSPREHRTHPKPSWQALQNGAGGSINGKPRDECLSLVWLRFRKQAAVVIEAWRHHYNTVHSLSSQGDLTRYEFKRRNHPAPKRAVLQE